VAQMKSSKFRHWINEKWFEHKDEILVYGAESFSTLSAYFAKHKWWLKTLYQQQQQEQQQRAAARKKHSRINSNKQGAAQ
jgi:cell division protein FtsB